MSLREEFDQVVREKKAQAKREEDIQIKEGLLPQEVRSVYKGVPWRTEGMYHVPWSAGGMYYDTLPIQLSPDCRELIDELIDLCPPQHWRTPPDKPDDIHIRWHADTGYLHFPLQYRLSDGSVHVGFCEAEIKKDLIRVKPKFRLTYKGKVAAFQDAKALAEQLTKEAVLQDAWQVLEERLFRNPMIVGSREFIEITYASAIRPEYADESYEKYINTIFIFRDGAVYDPYPCWEYNNGTFCRRLDESEFHGATQFLREECSRLVKHWASNI